VREIASRLERVDWDFPQAGTAPASIHKFHWFPGNFIPQIPAALIQILSAPGDVVLDPFGGSGTTVIEAARLGRRAIYSDRVSAGVFLTRAKLAATTVGLLPQTLDEVLNAITWDHTCVSDAYGENGEGSRIELSSWYAPRTLSQFRYLWKVIEQQCSTQKLILELVFSDLLFSCASTSGSLTSSGKRRRHHWGWIADNVVPKVLVEHDAVGAFRSRIISLAHRFDPIAFDPVILQCDARNLTIDSDSVDLVVTSPPYVGVIDYVHANRLLYLWMNWPFEEERFAEIGARFKRKRQLAVSQYLQEMAGCWQEIRRVLKPGGRLAMVIGESRAFPGTVEKTLEDLATLMSIEWGPRERRPTRRRVADRDARESKEILVVAEKR
jgi:hypothetical protein